MNGTKQAIPQPLGITKFCGSDFAAGEYLVRSGERNRALTIVKSRGTSHSNHVRELVLSATGSMLTDVYTAGGEVLMGTLRWEKEAEESASKTQRCAEFDHKRRELQSAEANTSAQIKALQMELQRQRAALAMYSSDNEVRNVSSSERENELRRMRSADPATRAPSAAASHARRHIAPGLAKKGGNGAAK